MPDGAFTIIRVKTGLSVALRQGWSAPLQVRIVRPPDASWLALSARHPNAEPHHYMATGCLHGLHGDCRRTCKFCGTLCVCRCHRPRPGRSG